MGEPIDSPGAEHHPNPEVAAWISFAAADLRTAIRESAQSVKPNFNAACFHAQQSAEKLMKAALVARGVIPPRVHDLVYIDAHLQRNVPGWQFDVTGLSVLSSAAVEARYPGFGADAAQAIESIDIARAIWIALRPLI